ncbi:DUF5018 domain-containing protein [Ichthyobacterium seriolicida]|uniref:Pkd domain containing protein n=1 Tax=Ichthyobacterium seriolicida TaxID=242600 RepID=A0A1J1DW76_9FLAO|nr:hypothetical protein [Ichthyobacterium seriolicida]BAV94114.1 hypothetical protein JBKA6_0101 [Ichthyobacterium seriolicida]
MKTFSLAKSVIFSFVLLSVFIFSCEKKNIYNNDFGVGIESFSLFDSENNEKKIGSDITCEIDTAQYTISLTVPNTAILEGLKFNIKLSDKFSISPASGDPVDLELVEPSEQSTETPSPKRYKKVFTLTSPDNTTQDYTVYMTRESTPVLSSFLINADKGKGIKAEVAAVITDDTETATGRILLKIPYNESIDLTGLSFTATIPDNHTLDPAAGTISEDINGKEFTLKTALGSQRIYTVTAVKGPYISDFKFESNPTGGTTNTGISTEGVTGNIDHIAGTISVTVPNGVTLSSLTPTITVGDNTKAEFTPSAQTNFSQSATTPIEYTVTSSNPSATDFTKIYTVTVTQNAEPQIETFKFTTASNNNKNLGNDISGTIDHNSGTITVKVPHNASLDVLTPTITPASTLANTQVYSGDTGQGAIAATSFEDSHTTPVKYSAVGPAGGRKVYSVKVYKEPRIKAFSFTKAQNTDNSGFPVSPAEYSGNITQGDFSANGTITITVANTVDVASLTPTITGSNLGSTSTPTALNFTTSDTSPYSATITVQNEYLDSFQKQYTVNLTKEAAPQLTEFKITANTGKGIAENSVTTTFEHPASDSDGKGGKIKLKFEHKVQSHNGDIDLTGLAFTSVPGDGHALAPSTPLGASESIHEKEFTLTTALGSTSKYTVTAVKGPFIKSFKFAAVSGSVNTGISNAVSGNINHETGAITITVPATVARESSENKITLTPTIELGGDNPTIVSPNTNTSTQFTSGTPVNCTVTANGMTKTYTVTVTREKSTIAQITSFTIDSATGNITHPSATDTSSKGRIVVPVTSPPASSTPTITQSDYASIAPSGAQTFDSYENPVTYTVTAEDNSSKTYEVYIYDSTKKLTDSDITVDAPAGSSVTSVDESTRVITITVPSSTTNLDNLTLTLTCSGTTPSYTLTADSTGTQNFSNEKEIKYTLKDSSSNVKGHYWVKVVKSS